MATSNDISGKGLKAVFATCSYKKTVVTSEYTIVKTVTATDEQMEQTKNIIGAALGDHALRVVRSVSETHRK